MSYSKLLTSIVRVKIDALLIACMLQQRPVFFACICHIWEEVSNSPDDNFRPNSPPTSLTMNIPNCSYESNGFQLCSCKQPNYVRSACLGNWLPAQQHGKDRQGRRFFPPLMHVIAAHVGQQQRTHAERQFVAKQAGEKARKTRPECVVFCA
jgi:hypothetical protein